VFSSTVVGDVTSVNAPGDLLDLAKDPSAQRSRHGASTLLRKMLKSVNTVNCLDANQSSKVVAEKSCGSRKMILSGKKKIIVHPKTGVEEEIAMKVDEAEKSDDGPIGVYFYLSVQPEKATALAAKFAEGTVWKVVPGFVRKVAKAVVVTNSIVFSDSDEDDEEDEEEGDCCGPTPTSWVDVGSSQAGTLSHGSVAYKRTRSVYRQFDFDHCSEPTVLSMSIWEDMKFLPLADIEQELKLVANDWIKNESKALIESLNGVFKTDTCVIDLESKADTIICSCGHQCIHHSNVSAGLLVCPMCRSPITAFCARRRQFRICWGDNGGRMRESYSRAGWWYRCLWVRRRRWWWLLESIRYAQPSGSTSYYRSKRTVLQTDR